MMSTFLALGTGCIPQVSTSAKARLKRRNLSESGPKTGPHRTGKTCHVGPLSAAKRAFYTASLPQYSQRVALAALQAIGMPEEKTSGASHKRHHTQRRQCKCRRERLVVQRPRLGVHTAIIALIASSINLGVAVEGFAPVSALGQAETIIRPGYRREIQDNQHAIGVVAILPDERKHTVVLIRAIHPEKSLVVEVALPQTRIVTIQSIGVLYEPLQAAMIWSLVQQVPIHAAVGVPLGALANFADHEEQFLARKKPLITKQRAQVREILPVIARHPAQQRAFAVHHFIV